MDSKQAFIMNVSYNYGRKSFECNVVKSIVRYNRPRCFETEESSLTNTVNINISNSKLITQAALIDTLLFDESILNARYFVFYKTCRLILSVSNYKQDCGISLIHNENSEEMISNFTLPPFQNKLT